VSLDAAAVDRLSRGCLVFEALAGEISIEDLARRGCFFQCPFVSERITASANRLSMILGPRSRLRRRPFAMLPDSRATLRALQVRY
jgi:hypothetical protein